MSYQWRYELSYLTVVETGHTKKTSIYEVIDSKGTVIANIRWYSPWRRYVLWPELPTVWEETCLKEISELLARLTREHKAMNDIIRANKAIVESGKVANCIKARES